MAENLSNQDKLSGLNSGNPMQPPLAQSPGHTSGQMPWEHKPVSEPPPHSPPASPPGQMWSQQPSPLSPSGTLLPVGRVEVGLTTFLSAITFGIYFLVWLYKVMKAYRVKSGRVGTNLEQLFWAYVITLGVTVVLMLVTVVLGFLALIASVVIGAMLVSAVLDDRDAIFAQTRPTLTPPSKGLLVTLYVVGNVVSLLFCLGIPFMIWFYVQFFKGHNQLIDAIE